jgi:hypothetical protein
METTPTKFHTWRRKDFFELVLLQLVLVQALKPSWLQGRCGVGS